ncbi:hypothetical protein CCUG63695_01544 [Mycobacteroides franklinii]|uniref:Uncharacterized protein n=1 Tax=Mycobacteroides franklinii TaxID=948102 RepID=A0A4R8RBQ1_9MYCO|nr:hypothetical protein BST24_26245 [Mycobacteroides franklinii]TDZ46720.1 hypothetical protein CCUG64054_00545 [Mycobacteroides franklinii]TDZ53754.1 hypothetical protein CCUG63697_00054 [Mycobacteroides franklinii]TDZ60437.1 hypothetical protein CCUG63696_00547 [Mycobacteroides franklinii]TDZ65836.1 hypothetical protein CCUG63695_01544 [Mycobacteroides franklinii]
MDHPLSWLADALDECQVSHDTATGWQDAESYRVMPALEHTSQAVGYGDVLVNAALSAMVSASR